MHLTGHGEARRPACLAAVSEVRASGGGANDASIQLFFLFKNLSLPGPPWLKVKESLGARWAPTSSLWPFVPALGPSSLLNFVFHALRPLKLCDPHR